MASMSADTSRALAKFIAQTGLGIEAARRLADDYGSSVLPEWLTENPAEATHSERIARVDAVLGGRDMDDMSRALAEALDEVWRARHVRTEAGAKKYGLPIGSPIGGSGRVVPSAAPRRRTSAKARLVAAIEDHLTGSGTSDPFDGFSREQLRQAAKARGVALDRGEPRESIAAKLLAHARGEPSPPTPAAARFHEHLDGIEDLAATVESGEIRTESQLSGGEVGVTYRLTYNDGTKVVRKGAPGVRDSDAEQMASLMGRALGLAAPRVYRNDPNIVFMDNVEGDLGAERMAEGLTQKGMEQLLGTDDGRMMGLLDLLINNPDRHSANWMMDDADRLHPIDHGNAFPDTVITLDGNNNLLPLDPEAARQATFVKSPFAYAYMSLLGTGWKDNDLTSRDVAVIRGRLRRLRPEFEHIGRGAWLDFALARLDEVGKRATGTTSRLLPSQL